MAVDLNHFPHAMEIDPITNKPMGKVAAKLAGSNAQLFDGTVSWVNSEAAGAVKTIDIPLPTTLQSDALYEIVITNPSIETALTVVASNKETFGTNVRYPEVNRFGLSVSTPNGKAVLVQGWFLGEAGRLAISNDTAIGLSGAFSAEVRVRKV